MNWREYKENLQKDYLEKLMEQTQGNVTQAASLAGVQREDFYKILKRFHVEPTSYRIQSSTVVKFLLTRTVTKA